MQALHKLGFGIHFIPNFAMNFYPFPLEWWSVQRWSHPWMGRERHNLKLGPFWFAVDRPPPVSACGACGREAPLVWGECPDCRH